MMIVISVKVINMQGYSAAIGYSAHKLFDKLHIEITSLQTKRLSAQKLEITLLVRYPAAYNAEDVVKLLKDIPAIKSIEY